MMGSGGEKRIQNVKLEKESNLCSCEIEVCVRHTGVNAQQAARD